MSKTFFIIPGFKSQATDRQYHWLVRFLKKNDFTIKLVPVTWDRQVLTQNAADFLAYFAANKSDENYVLGFSYGAVIALMTASQTKPERLYLCSLSPDVAEDAQAMPQWLRNYIGKKRFADTSTRSGRDLAKVLTSVTYVFYGEGEAKAYPPLRKRSIETVRYARQASLVEVPEASHQIDHPNYQKALMNVIG